MRLTVSPFENIRNDQKHHIHRAFLHHAGGSIRDEDISKRNSFEEIVSGFRHSVKKLQKEFNPGHVLIEIVYCDLKTGKLDVQKILGRVF